MNIELNVATPHELLVSTLVSEALVIVRELEEKLRAPGHRTVVTYHDLYQYWAVRKYHVESIKQAFVSLVKAGWHVYMPEPPFIVACKKILVCKDSLISLKKLYDYPYWAKDYPSDDSIDGFYLLDINKRLYNSQFH
jgi:hypothetical protein